MVPKFIVLLGAPGAGKGTQAEGLSKTLSTPHVASGYLFREALEQETELGMLAKSYIEKGELVPDKVTIAMVQGRVAASDCEGGAILDGFPRTIEQAEALERALAGDGKSVCGVLYIKVSTETLMARLGGRWVCRNCGAVYHSLFDPPKKRASVISAVASSINVPMTRRRSSGRGLMSISPKRHPLLSITEVKVF